MCKLISSNYSFKNKVTKKLFTYNSYIQKKDAALNNPQWLICH